MPGLKFFPRFAAAADSCFFRLGSRSGRHCLQFWLYLFTIGRSIGVRGAHCLPALTQLEDADYLRQIAGLILQGFGCRRRLFHQGGILLGDFVHLADRLIDLFDAGCLFLHPEQPIQLDTKRYAMLRLGSEHFRPYAKANEPGHG